MRSFPTEELEAVDLRLLGILPEYLAGDPQPSIYSEILAAREQRAQARTPLGRLPTLLLYLQRKQLVRFAQFCRRTGRPLDADRWLFSMAWTVKALSGWVRVQFKGMKESEKGWNPVLSRQELRLWAVEAGLAHITEAQLQQAEIAVCRAPRSPIPPALQGSLLRITAAERDASRLWTMQAIDEDPWQRRERKLAEKQERDRLCKAAKDEAARQAGKRMPREAYEARAAQRAENLQAIMATHGKSRRTVYEWLKKGDPRAEALKDFDLAAENCTSVVADIERSSTLTESPIIERPHLCSSGSGIQSHLVHKLEPIRATGSVVIPGPWSVASGRLLGPQNSPQPRSLPRSIGSPKGRDRTLRFSSRRYG